MMNVAELERAWLCPACISSLLCELQCAFSEFGLPPKVCLGEYEVLGLMRLVRKTKKRY